MKCLRNRSACFAGYEAWPGGKAVGPVARLSGLTPAARTAQLLEWLPEFQRLGWMTGDAWKRYESILGGEGVRGLTSRLDADLASQQITGEVAAIVRGLAR